MIHVRVIGADYPYGSQIYKVDRDMRSLSKILFGLLFFSMGCSNKNFTAIDDSEGKQSEVEVSASLPISKGVSVNQTSDLVAGSTMSVFCSYTSAVDWTSNSDLNKMFNKKLTLNSTRDKWNYVAGEEVKWQFVSLADRYSFFGYMPYAAGVYDAQSNAAGNGLVVKTAKVLGEPEIVYTVPNGRVASQPDLMFAVPRKNNRYTNGSVMLEMQHALTQITFAARTSAGYAGVDVRIKKITLTDIVCESAATINGGNITWSQVDPVVKRDVSVSQNTSDPNNPASLKDYVLSKTTTTTSDISTSDGALFMIPQSINGTGKNIVIVLEEVVAGGKTLEFALALTSPEVDGTWKSGKSYKYTILYNGQGEVPYSVTTSIVSWSSQDVSEKLPATYLNVSTPNIVIKSGIGSKIYFSSDASSVVAKWSDGSLLTKSGNSFIVPNNLSVGRYNVTVQADKLSCNVSILVQSASGGADVLYFNSDGTLAVGKWGYDVTVQNNLAFFKFGSVVGFRNNNDAWNTNMSQVAFNPTSLTVGSGALYEINTYGNNSTVLPAIPGWVYNDYVNYYNAAAADKSKYVTSGVNYHTVSNVRVGKGDPCKLAGLTLSQIRSGVIDNYKWRMPTRDENVAFIGTKSTMGSWPQPSNPGYWFPNPSYFNTTGEFLRAAGYRYANGVPGYVGEYGYYWSSEPYDGSYGYDFSFQITDVYPYGSSDYAVGLPVRCVPR